MTVLVACIAFMAQADDLDKIRAKGEVVFGVRNSSPPFGFFDKARGTVTGYDIDFATLIARKLGVKPIFKTVEPGDRIKVLTDGRADLVIAAMGKSAEREKEVDFSLGYFVSTQKVVAKKGTIKDLIQLEKKTVCVSLGTSNGAKLKAISQNIMLVEVADYDEIFTALQAGRCDAGSGGEAALLGNLAKMPGKSAYEVPDVPIASEAFAVAMRKGETKLQQQVNEALATAEKTGEAEKIYDRWFGPGAAVQLPRAFKISR
ncbi:transporter substrate-binding domain-containing protein [Chitinimonas sp. BJB300]|uniref:transporter substrate-binding domain-containing protein n=2 Tax=Chitinimonas sp. BJB300 TaxID=1559339 RepID=UPI001304302B|nr:transporter substrate-binding domain-containing protein [Chitinimonas sp. BJB300]